MQFEERTYTLPEWAVNYIEYGPDAMGNITEEEAVQIDAFLSNQGLIGATWEYGESYFHYTNDVFHNVGGEVIEAKAFIPMQ